MKRILFLLLILITVIGFVFSESMHSPTWGFFLELPVGFEYIEGDERDRFSFAGPAGLMFDLVVYDGRYETLQDMVINVNRNLSNNGSAHYFDYGDKKAAFLELDFDIFHGYGLCIELSKPGAMMVALAYCEKNIEGMELFHFSALNSISPSVNERLSPGPIMHFAYPRGELKNITLEGGVPAMVYENDAEAAQALIEQEYSVLSAYINLDVEVVYAAWTRYYRMIFRDSFDRIVIPVIALVQAWGGLEAETTEDKRAFAQKALHFVQGFKEERNLTESDFINLVSAITERRGDCDSRSMLLAVILTCADIRAAIMVSREYSHALALADIEGFGTRFHAYGVRWLVAETMSDLDLGLIYEEVSDARYWLPIIFE